jgi:hypothetical protein
MAGLVFLLVLWVLAGACQRHGVVGFFKIEIHHHHHPFCATIETNQVLRL